MVISELVRQKREAAVTQARQVVAELQVLKDSLGTPTNGGGSGCSGGEYGSEFAELWFDGVRPAMRRLARRGVAIAAATSNLREVADALLLAGGVVISFKTYKSLC